VRVTVGVDLTFDRSCGALGEADCSVDVALDLRRGEADVGKPVWRDRIDDPAANELTLDEEERARCAAWEKYALDRQGYQEDAT
jgi:hypothetical protein